MDFEQRWLIINELGEGGQGKVFRVCDSSKLNIAGYLYPLIEKTIRGFSGVQYKDSMIKNCKNFCDIVTKIMQMEDSRNLGALKLLHEPGDARDFERAEERIKKEIKAMSSFSHPNLLKILDYDPDAKWFVSEFHPNGTLIDKKEQFTGNFVDSLRAFRFLVEGVSELHKNGVVHRDIKPQNVFIASNGNLILGDFGLVFFTDAMHTRISGTFENVGSRDWMPAWAMAMKIEDIKPSFDTFSLGKLLWGMISNKPVLNLWYFDQHGSNLEEMFPNAQYIKLANQLLKKCVVEYEKDCLPDATALLSEVDEILSIIDMKADLISDDIERPCKVCGIGSHQLNTNRNLVNNLGFNPGADKFFKIFTCNHCGHIQLFDFGNGTNLPPAWNTNSMWQKWVKES